MTLTPEQQAQDLKVLVTTLKEVHPDLYRVCPPEKFEARVKEIESHCLQSRGYLEFLKDIAVLFTDMGCIGTQWGHATKYLHYRKEHSLVFPLDLKWVGDRVYVTGNYSGLSRPLEGTEVLAINGVSLKDYVRLNRGLLPWDGASRSLQLRWLETYFPNHHSNFWEQPDSFQVRIWTKEQKKETLTIPARTPQSVNAQKRLKEPERFYDFQVVEGVGTLRISMFPAPWMNGPRIPVLPWMDSCFTALKEGKVQDLILNLDGMGGYGSGFGALLYSYLSPDSFVYADEVKCNSDQGCTFSEHITSKPPWPCNVWDELTQKQEARPNRFRGNLYVVTQGGVYGGRSYFCGKLMERPYTKFMGQECGGNPSRDLEEAIVLHLPHSGISVSIPTVEFVNKSLRARKVRLERPSRNPGRPAPRKSGRK